jgi:uncharacterized protein (TIGR01244 family)
MTMKIVKLTEQIGVSHQVVPEEVQAVADAGYQVLVNNRPDGEAEGQPSSADIAAAAEAAGLEYHYLPVTAGNFPGQGAERMSALFSDPQRPVLAFCRTGTRCTNLWVATREEGHRTQAREHALGLGYDLAMSTPK